MGPGKRRPRVSLLPGGCPVDENGCGERGWKNAGWALMDRAPVTQRGRMMRLGSRWWIARAALVLALGLALAGCTGGPSEQAREHQRRAEAYMAEGKLREASVEYQAGLQKAPGDPDLLYGLARALNAQGEAREYRATLEKVLRARPDHPEACTEMAGLLLATRSFPQALELARRALAARPGYLDAMVAEARALTGLGRVDEAREAWARVLDAGPRAEGPFEMAADFESRTGRPERAMEILDRGIEVLPGSVRLRLDKAALLVRRGKVAEAEALVDATLERFPDDPAAYAAKAKILLGKGEREKALAFLDEAAARFRSDAEKAAQMAGERAAVLVGLGDLEGAIGVLEEARDAAPDNPGLAAMLADVLITAGRTDEARVLLAKARPADRTGRTARLLEARLYLQDGQPHRARMVLEPLVASGDLGVDLHYLYAKALALSRRWVDARMEYLMVLDRLPNHQMARIDYAHLLYAMGDPEGALAQIAVLPPALRSSPRVRLLKAKALLAKGDIDEAEDVVKGLKELAPDNPVLLALQGDLERARGKLRRALKLYKKAAEGSPEALEPVLAQADVMGELGTPLRDIRAVLDEYQSRNGESPYVLNFLARMYLDAGRVVSAGKVIDRSLLLEPNYWETRYLKGRLHLAQGEESRAAVEFEEAIKLGPSRPEPYNDLAALYRKQGDLERAEKVYRRLLDRNPREPVTSNNLATLLIETGRPAEAVDLARVALAGAPANPHVMDTLGWALQEAGDPDRAAAFLERAAAGLPDSPEVLYHWAENLRARGLAGEAARVAARVREIAPESSFAAAVARWEREDP